MGVGDVDLFLKRNPKVNTKFLQNLDEEFSDICCIIGMFYADCQSNSMILISCRKTSCSTHITS